MQDKKVIDRLNLAWMKLHIMNTNIKITEINILAIIPQVMQPMKPMNPQAIQILIWIQIIKMVLETKRIFIKTKKMLIKMILMKPQLKKSKLTFLPNKLKI